MTLVPITMQDYPTFIEEASDTYATGAAESGEMTFEQARARASDDLAALLPAGPSTPGMLLWTISIDGEPVGHVWLGVRGSADAQYGWLWSLYIRPGHRGRGLATQAIRRAEIEAKRLFGVDEVRLNVFAANVGAVRLYERLGYAVTSQVMRRAIGP